MLAEQRRGPPDRARRRAELHRDAERRRPCPPPGAPSRPPSRAPACAGRRRPARSRGSARRDARLEQRSTQSSVSRAASADSSSATSSGRFAIRVGVGREARVVGQVRPADRRAQPLPQLLVVAADGDVAVARAQRLVGRGEPVRGAERLRAPGRSPTAPRSPRSRARARPRTATCRSAARGRCARARASAHRMPIAQNSPAERSETGTPHLTGLPPGSPVTLMTPDSALRDQVEARPLRVRAGLPEARDRGVDQPRVERAQRLVVGARAAPRRPAGSSPARRRRSRPAGGGSRDRRRP